MSVLIFLGLAAYGIYFVISLPKENPKVLSSQTVATISLSSGKCHALQVDLFDPQAFIPDPNCTPGVIDIGVTQENIYETICKAGYTKTVRPPVAYTNNLKAQQIVEYGYRDTNLKDYEEDHFISLELGGSPADPKNLWPEPGASFNEKDNAENYLHSQVCSGAMSLKDAQALIAKNWYEVYKRMR